MKFKTMEPNSTVTKPGVIILIGVFFLLFFPPSLFGAITSSSSNLSWVNIFIGVAGGLAFFL